ncbi:hypothetical protein ISS30_09145 [bacterium]|nr:hypothetical protein [bacterium]
MLLAISNGLKPSAKVVMKQATVFSRPPMEAISSPDIVALVIMISI